MEIHYIRADLLQQLSKSLDGIGSDGCPGVKGQQTLMRHLSSNHTWHEDLSYA